MTVGLPTLSDVVCEGIATECTVENGLASDPSRAREGRVTEASPHTSEYYLYYLIAYLIPLKSPLDTSQ